MKKDILFVIAFVLCCSHALAQGCIAVRNLVGFGQFALPKYEEEPTKWLINVNTRYFKFEKEYWGTDNQDVKTEDQKPTRVFVADVSITRMLDKGWSFTIDIPVTAGERSSWQEHPAGKATKTKYTTRSFGLSDIRVTAYKWLWDVSELHKGNIQIGVGIKLPTGDYRFQDYYHGDSLLVMAPVNQSIQLGDGGTGFSLEANGFYTVNKTINLYANAFYLFSPRDVNGTYAFGIAQASKDQINATATINSVADGFTVRAGANFSIENLTLGIGGRFEGSPVHDLIGLSNGNRRAGSVGSIEPGLNYRWNRTVVYAFVPFSVYRNAKQIVPDQRLDQMDPATAPHKSQGGFSDYMVFFGVLFMM